MLFSKDIHWPTVLRNRQKLCTLISLSYLTLEDPRLLSHTCLVFPHTRLLKGIRYVRVSTPIWQLNLIKKVLFCLLQKKLNAGSIILIQPLDQKATKCRSIDLITFSYKWILGNKPTKWKKIQIAANIHSKLIFEICYLIPSATPTPDTKKLYVLLTVWVLNWKILA